MSIAEPDRISGANAHGGTAMQEFAVDTAFGRIAGLRSTGRGQRVLALHGWLDNAASFVPLQRHLTGLDLASIDMPGHGASAHLPPAADYTMVTFARACVAVADALGWDRFSLLAHSLGGAVASVIAAACPKRIERLLLIESLGALAQPEHSTATRLREAFATSVMRNRPLRVFADIATPVQVRMQINGLSEPVARLLVERGLAPMPAFIDEYGSDSTAGGFVWRSDPRLTQPTAVRMSEAQVRNLVAHIECPTRVIYAEPAQAYFKEALRRERFALLPHGELVVMPGSHHLHMEAPAEVADAIGDFLVRPSAAGAIPGQADVPG